MASKKVASEDVSHCLGLGCSRIGIHDRGANSISWYDTNKNGVLLGDPVGWEEWTCASKSPYCPECWEKIKARSKETK